MAAELPGQLEQIDHLPGTGLLAVPGDQSLPEFVEAVRPQTRTSLLLEGTRSSQRPGLPREHVKIMFEIQNLLVSPVTTLMLRHGTTVMPKLHGARVALGLHLRSSRQRHGIAVGQHLDASQTVDGRKGDARQILSYAKTRSASEM